MYTLYMVKVLLYSTSLHWWVWDSYHLTFTVNGGGRRAGGNNEEFVACAPVRGSEKITLAVQRCASLDAEGRALLKV